MSNLEEIQQKVNKLAHEKRILLDVIGLMNAGAGLFSNILNEKSATEKEVELFNEATIKMQEATALLRTLL